MDRRRLMAQPTRTPLLLLAGLALATVPSIVFRALDWTVMLQIWYAVSLVGFLAGIVLVARWSRQ